MLKWLSKIQTIKTYKAVYRDGDKLQKFKENIWRNKKIPYVRYYKYGQFIAESNHVLEGDFINVFK